MSQSTVYIAPPRRRWRRRRVCLPYTKRNIPGRRGRRVQIGLYRFLRSAGFHLQTPARLSANALILRGAADSLRTASATYLRAPRSPDRLLCIGEPTSQSLCSSSSSSRAAAAKRRKYWVGVRKHKQGRERVRNGVASFRRGGLGVAPPIKKIRGQIAYIKCAPR